MESGTMNQLLPEAVSEYMEKSPESNAHVLVSSESDLIASLPAGLPSEDDVLPFLFFLDRWAERSLIGAKALDIAMKAAIA